MEEFSRTYPNNNVSAALLDAIRDKGAFRRFNKLIAEFSIQTSGINFNNRLMKRSLSTG